MKFTILIATLSLRVVSFCPAQENSRSKLNFMQGVWLENFSTDSVMAFAVMNGKFSLSFVYELSEGLDFPLVELTEGFYDGDIEIDSLHVDSLKEDGERYVVIHKENISAQGWVHQPYFLTPGYFECDGELMSINGGQLVEFGKIAELPFEAIVRLYNRGKSDRRDYIKEYLGIKVTSIISTTAKVYNQPRKQVISSLGRNDIVVVLDKNGKWIKIQYGDQDVGWIKKSDTYQHTDSNKNTKRVPNV